jgi:hypothetical protein
MIYISTPIYATVWSAKPAEKYIDLRVSTSEKKQDGTYESSNWFPRAVGHAFNTLKEVKERDRICITKAKLTNARYTTESGEPKSSFKFVIIEASICTDEQAKPAVTAETEAKKQINIEQNEPTADDCPW